MKERLNAGNSTLKLFPSPGKNRTKTLKDSKSVTLDEEMIVEGIIWNMPSNFFRNSVVQKNSESHCLIWQRTRSRQTVFVSGLCREISQTKATAKLINVYI